MFNKIFGLVLAILLSRFVYASDLDDISACAGVVVGDAVVDLTLGVNEEKFDDTFRYAAGLQIAALQSVDFADDEALISDQLFSANMDKMTNTYNAGAYTSDALIEVINCYRILAPMSAKYSTELRATEATLNRLVPERILLIRRMLQAGG